MKRIVIIIFALLISVNVFAELKVDENVIKNLKNLEKLNNEQKQALQKFLQTKPKAEQKKDYFLEKYNIDISTIKSEEDLYNIPLEVIKSIALNGDLDKFINAINTSKKVLHILYLFSSSMPEQAVSNIFQQYEKVHQYFNEVKFYAVMTGVDIEIKDRQGYKFFDEIFKKKQFENIHVKINPYIFKMNNVKKVPAFLVANCSNDELRSDECEFKYIVYGDMTLLHALEIIKDKTGDKEISDIYYTIRQEF